MMLSFEPHVVDTEEVMTRCVVHSHSSILFQNDSESKA